MNDLRDLYQEVILDHNKNPKNFGKLDPADHSAEGYNPLCGDKLSLTLNLDGDVISDIKFEGSGCAISKASGSLMTQAVRGKTLEEAEVLFNGIHDLLTGDPSVRESAAPSLGKLAVFEGVREFPMRVKCATLAWHTLQAALKDRGNEAVSTE